MITSHHNEQLKTIRKLHQRSWRERLGLFSAEGEDLVAAAEAAGWAPELLLRAGVEVDGELLERVSALGSGTRVIGVYRQRWSEPDGEVSVYLHGVRDPGNVGTMIRSAHALCDGPVILGPGCADPWSPKAVRASMGSVFARPPARAGFAELRGRTVALDPRARRTLGEVGAERPVCLCLGGEREGLPGELVERADAAARIPLRAAGPESLNVAMAATVALYEVNRMAADA
ncbi:MAG TPA: RNA methyltransferase [Thermoleophilaceae bacterium]|nr:RNA methyltransferase [Thermoleophilaceae bacterium]